VGIPGIASGGVGTMEHICGTYTVGEIKEYLRGRGRGVKASAAPPWNKSEASFEKCMNP